MVFMIIIPFLNGYFIGNINPTFSDKPIGLRENLQESPIFDGKNPWVSGVDFPNKTNPLSDRLTI